MEKEEELNNKEELVQKPLRMPKPLSDAIFLASLKQSEESGKRVAENTVMVEALSGVFLPNLSSKS